MGPGISPVFNREGAIFPQESLDESRGDKLREIAQETLSGEHDTETERKMNATFQVNTEAGILDIKFAKNMSDQELLCWINY